MYSAQGVLHVFTLPNMPVLYFTLPEVHFTLPEVHFTLPEVDYRLELAPQFTLPDPTHIGGFILM